MVPFSRKSLNTAGLSSAVAVAALYARFTVKALVSAACVVQPACQGDPDRLRKERFAASAWG